MAFPAHTSVIRSLLSVITTSLPPPHLILHQQVCEAECARVILLDQPQRLLRLVLQDLQGEVGEGLRPGAQQRRAPSVGDGESAESSLQGKEKGRWQVGGG